MSSFVFDDKIVYFDGVEKNLFSNSILIFDSTKLRWKKKEFGHNDFSGYAGDATVLYGQFIISIGGRNER
jgi:N-acetylneuraminic acid mutarotase